MVTIENGGQTPPILNVGATLEWKKLQKIAKKNIISEAINKSIPNLIPFCTIIECWSSNVASRITSHHQQ